MTPIRRRVLAATALALVLGLAGCSAATLDSGAVPGDSSGSGTSGAAVEPSVGNATKNATTLDSMGVGGSSTVTTTWMQVAVDNPTSAADDAATIAQSANGYVEARSESTGGSVVVPMTDAAAKNSTHSDTSPETVSLTLRVPTAASASVIDDLKALGRVSSYNQSQYDVGLQQADIEARIASLTSSLTALRNLQSSATSVADLLAAEAAVSSRQAELDSLIAQRDYLTGQVEMTSISVEFMSTSLGLPANLTFLDGLAFGWGSISTAVAALGVAFGFLIPWLAVVIVLAGIAAAIAIPLVRRSRARAAAISATRKGTRSNAGATPARSARTPRSK